ncbi:ADP-ribosylglycohydrolase family protein [Desulfogranum marinum]|uniref:ADP-ribosylglycohydrolase family protein n=1 Tax=Desulfogranum marinum TaxID=453220 RepID=UPI0019625F80|nr:ADP-ribosylglycohydrolase family protein [Desulfogranum marinum]MBM9514650.1 ADP-ribosylglycohydrolase family protein [Desulfogranum marinum]
MIGAIAGDIIGSVYEAMPIKSKDFPLFQKASVFTDDTVLTVAVASAILKKCEYASSLKLFGRKYPNAGYGGAFFRWLFSPNSEPYNSWGNGSAMRVSPVGFAFDTVEKVLAEAQKSAEVTHNHPEGIKGAQATALAILLARMGASKAEIKQEISRYFSYDLTRDLDAIRPQYSFDISCQGSVPASIIAFLSSTDYEDAIRNAISLGGDSDTMACIAGGIAQAYYKKIPEEIVHQVRQRLPQSFWEIISEFNRKFGLQ